MVHQSISQNLAVVTRPHLIFYLVHPSHISACSYHITGTFGITTAQWGYSIWLWLYPWCPNRFFVHPSDIFACRPVIYSYCVTDIMGITTAQWRSSIGLFVPRARTKTRSKSTDHQRRCQSADITEDELLKDNDTREPTLAQGNILQEQEKTSTNHQQVCYFTVSIYSNDIYIPLQNKSKTYFRKTSYKNEKKQATTMNKYVNLFTYIF